MAAEWRASRRGRLRLTARRTAPIIYKSSSKLSSGVSWPYLELLLYRLWTLWSSTENYGVSRSSLCDEDRGFDDEFDSNDFFMMCVMTVITMGSIIMIPCFFC